MLTILYVRNAKNNSLLQKKMFIHILAIVYFFFNKFYNYLTIIKKKNRLVMVNFLKVYLNEIFLVEYLI